MPDQKLQYPTCAHIFPEGNYCLSPAMRNSLYCYFHTRDRQRQRNLAHAADLKRSRPFVRPDQLEAEIMQSLGFPDLDDACSLQIALSTVVRAVLFGHLNSARAGLALRGIRTAVHNYKNLRKGRSGVGYAIEDPEPISPLISPCAPDPWELQEEEDEPQEDQVAEGHERSEETPPASEMPDAHDNAPSPTLEKPETRNEKPFLQVLS
jgi:hypothetical protein